MRVVVPSGAMRQTAVRFEISTGPQSAGPARYMFLAQSTGKVYYVPGGEGKSGQGNPHPVSPWGQKTKGLHTRKNKRTQSMIVSSRHRNK